MTSRTTRREILTRQISELTELVGKDNVAAVLDDIIDEGIKKRKKDKTLKAVENVSENEQHSYSIPNFPGYQPKDLIEFSKAIQFDYRYASSKENQSKQIQLVTGTWEDGTDKLDRNNFNKLRLDELTPEQKTLLEIFARDVKRFASEHNIKIPKLNFTSDQT